MPLRSHAGRAWRSSRTRGAGTPEIERIEFRAAIIAAAGPGCDERVDVFTLPDRSFELPVMGIFEVADGKVKAWRDYFDINQFTARMG